MSWRRSRTTRVRLALVGDMPPDTPPTDGPSFGEIAELHREMLYRVALRLSGNRATADDLVQEALLRARLRFDRFQPGTNAGTWLATILTNLFLDQIKHEKVIRKAEPELVALAADADLYEAIGALEPELRKVIELCYLQQMRYREVAATLNLPVGTIGTRLMRARARLREFLTPTSLDAVKP
jgi:RNA polymerase sigma-70 factor (ECF subfamily)